MTTCRPRFFATLLCLAALGLPALAAQPTTSPSPAAVKPAAAPPAASPASSPAAASTPPAPDPAKFPNVVARVNGADVTKGQLMEEVRSFLQGAGQQGPPPVAFYHQVLDQMIGTRLLYEEAKVEGLAAADVDVDKRYQEVRAGFKGDDKAFNDLLTQRGLTVAALKAGIKENLSIEKLVTTKVLPGIQVSDQAVKQFYDDHKAQMARPEQFKASHILIGVKKDAAPAEREAAKKKAEALLVQLKSGGDFAKLAKENSDDPGSKEHGGELPWLEPGQTVPEFEKAAMALKPGELSSVVETQFGYHILKLGEHRAAGPVPLEEAKERIVAHLRRQAVSENLQKRVESLRAKAKVDIFL